MLNKRFLAAAVFLPFFVFITFYRNNIFFFLTLSAVVLIGLYEFFSIAEMKKISPFKILGYALGALLLGGTYYSVAGAGDFISGREGWRPGTTIAAIVTLLVISSFVVAMLRRGNFTITDVGTTIFGVMYISWLLGHLLLLISLPYGSIYLFVLFFVTWVGDGGAYLVGRKLGKHKLIPRISPNKTVEGSVAGLVTTVVAIIVFKAIEFKEPLSVYLGGDLFLLDFKGLLPGFSYPEAIVLGFLIGVFGQVGDLAESLVKRDAGVKDSGNVLPGHGGVLDVMDSLMFVGPVFYYFLVFVVGGH